jgi:hypothetical protein
MEATDPGEIRIRLDKLDPFLGAPAASPFHDGRISEEADRFLRNRVHPHRKGPAQWLVILVPPRGAHEARTAIDALRRHAERSEEACRDRVREVLREGRWNLLIGMLFLIPMVLLARSVHLVLPSGTLASTIEQGITILGWVALWRPMEQLLYDWRPLRRDAEHYARLAVLEVEVREEA